MIQDFQIVYWLRHATIFGSNVDSIPKAAKGFFRLMSHDQGLVGLGDCNCYFFPNTTTTT